MCDRNIDFGAPRPSLERYKTAYSCLLSGDDSVGTALLDEVSAIDGFQRDWNFVRTALWNSTDCLPKEHWQRFQFADAKPHAVSYAYAVRIEAMGPLIMGLLEAEKYDAVHRLYDGLTFGLEGPRSAFPHGSEQDPNCNMTAGQN